MNMDLYNLLNRVSGKMSWRCSSYNALCTAVWKKKKTCKSCKDKKHSQTYQEFNGSVIVVLNDIFNLWHWSLHSEWCRKDL